MRCNSYETDTFNLSERHIGVAWWCNGYDVRLATQRVAIGLTAVLLSGNNLRQVVHTHVPLSLSSINWYRSKGDDALQLRR